MHLFPMKTGSSFCPALSTERQGQRLAIRVCRRGMAAREGQKQCPVRCSIWQEDTILSRRSLKVQKTKVWSSWRGPRRPELEEVCKEPMYSIYKVGLCRIAFLEMGKDKVNGICGVPVAVSASQLHCASSHLRSDPKLQNWR